MRPCVHLETYPFKARGVGGCATGAAAMGGRRLRDAVRAGAEGTAESGAEVLRAPVLRRAASAYVAGPALDDAMLACRTLRECGGTPSALESGKRGTGVAETYRAAAEAVSQNGLDASSRSRRRRLDSRPIW